MITKFVFGKKRKARVNPIIQKIEDVLNYNTSLFTKFYRILNAQYIGNINI